MDTPTPLWRARPITDWRDNGDAAFIVGGLIFFLLCLAGLIWTWNRPNDILPPDIMAALAASSLYFAIVVICVRAFGKSEWTFDGRTLHFTAGRRRRPDLELSRIRLVDIADRTDGLCDLLFYLQPGKGGDSYGWFPIPRLPKDNAEAGLDALRRAGVPVATPLDAPAHAFPAWMTPRERRALGSFLGRGERLLWTEGPAPRTPFILWYIFLLGLDCYIASCVFDLASIATRLRNALQSSDGTTAALMLLLLATALLVLLAVFVASPLFVHTHRWLSVRWISTHRLSGVSAPDGRRHLLATACLTEPPVTVPRSRNRADVFIAFADGTTAPLSTLATTPRPRKRALGFWNLTPPDATSALAALSAAFATEPGA